MLHPSRPEPIRLVELAPSKQEATLWISCSCCRCLLHRRRSSFITAGCSATSRQMRTRVAVSGSVLHHVSPALVSARLASQIPCLHSVARSISQNLYLCILDASCMQKKPEKKAPSAKVWGRRRSPQSPPTSPGCVPLSTAASALANDQE